MHFFLILFSNKLFSVFITIIYWKIFFFSKIVWNDIFGAFIKLYRRNINYCGQFIKNKKMEKCLIVLTIYVFYQIKDRSSLN